MNKKADEYTFIPHNCEICGAKLYYVYNSLNKRRSNYVWHKGLYFCDGCFSDRKKLSRYR